MIPCHDNPPPTPKGSNNTAQGWTASGSRGPTLGNPAPVPSNPERVAHLITVREYGDAYIARGNGKTASCTSDARTAVERVAMKLKGLECDYNKPGFVPFESTGITLKNVTPRQYLAEWEAA